MADANHTADGHNPLCGDQLTVYARVEEGVVQEASFVGHGCAISTASASLMTEAVKGQPIEEVEALFRDMHAMLTEAHPEERDFRSEEHTSELQSLMRTSYAVFCLKNKNNLTETNKSNDTQQQYI